MAMVKIYTTPTCPYCMQAKMLLKNKGQAFEEVNMPAGTITHINATVGIDIAFFTLMAKLINFKLLWRACNIKFKRACGYVWRIEATIKFGGDIR